VKTHLPDLVTAATGVLATLLATGFFAAGFGAVLATGLTGLLPRALRALEGAALLRWVTEDFDFAELFLVFDAALAMAYNIRERGKGVGALHHVMAASRKLRSRVSADVK
jgi:hypothetical protein